MAADWLTAWEGTGMEDVGTMVGEMVAKEEEEADAVPLALGAAEVLAVTLIDAGDIVGASDRRVDPEKATVGIAVCVGSAIVVAPNAVDAADELLSGATELLGTSTLEEDGNEAVGDRVAVNKGLIVDGSDTAAGQTILATKVSWKAESPDVRILLTSVKLQICSGLPATTANSVWCSSEIAPIPMTVTSVPVSRNISAACRTNSGDSCDWLSVNIITLVSSSLYPLAGTSTSDMT